MTVKIQRRTGLGMPQPAGDREDICAAVDQNAGHGMAEGVGVDMPQSMPPAELIQPAVYTVRVNRTSVFSGEYIAAFLPAIPHAGFCALLIRCVPQEKVHRFRRDFDVPLTFGCFGRLCVGTSVRGWKGLADMENTMFQIHLGPCETADLSSPASGHDQQVYQTSPADGLRLQSRQYGRNLLRLESIDLLAAGFGRCGLAGRIIWYNQFLLRLTEDGSDEAVVLQNAFRR